jgi:hypothetical protein
MNEKFEPMPPKDEPLYLRVGDWDPKNPRSGNYAKGRPEAGLSVYDLDEKGNPVVPPEGEWAEEDMHDRLRGDEPKYIVSGQHVGIGNDGEPLLHKIKVHGHWRPGWNRSRPPAELEEEETESHSSRHHLGGHFGAINA